MKCRDCLIWQNRGEEIRDGIDTRVSYYSRRGLAIQAEVEQGQGQEEVKVHAELRDTECENPCVLFNKAILVAK